VAQLSRRAGPAAALVFARPDESLRVDLWRLSGPSAVRVGRFETVSLSRLPGAQRTVMLGHWSGPRADLFVLDRGTRAGGMQVRVLAGEAHFRSTVLSVTLTKAGGFDRRDWTVDLQDLTGSGRSDIVFTTRAAATGSGRVEVHALAAQTNFSRYLLQVPTTRSPAQMSGHRALVIRRRGRVQWLLVNLATGSSIAHPLLAAPRRPRTP
jgi:hypothetical protein